MSSQSSQHPDEPAKTRSRKKTKKPWVVEYRFNRPGSIFGGTWWRFGKYKDQATAEKVLEVKSKDRWFDFRISVPGYAIDDAQAPDLVSHATKKGAPS